MEISEVKSKLNTKVEYNGVEYILSGCILRKNDDGQLVYQAEIKDVKANSVIICRLSDMR